MKTTYSILAIIAIAFAIASCGKQNLAPDTGGHAGLVVNPPAPPKIYNVMVAGGNMVVDRKWQKALNFYMAQGFGGTSIHLDSSVVGDRVTTELVNAEKGTAVIDSTDRYVRSVLFSNIYNDRTNRYGADAADSATNVYIELKGLKSPYTGLPIILRAFLNNDGTLGGGTISFFGGSVVNFKVDVAFFEKIYRTDNMNNAGAVIAVN